MCSGTPTGLGLAHSDITKFNTYDIKKPRNDQICCISAGCKRTQHGILQCVLEGCKESIFCFHGTKGNGNFQREVESKLKIFAIWRAKAKLGRSVLVPATLNNVK